MLIQYSVKNYKSIKDEIIINFSSSNNNIETNKLMNDNKVPPIYKCIGLIGPNASGKTNIIESLFFALRFINETIERRENSKINVELFMLDQESRKDAASFEFIFIENNIKYIYGFSINTKEILEEYLLAYYSKKATTVFERLVDNQTIYNFKGNDVKTQTQLSKKTNANRLYLPVAAEWGYEKAKPPYKWFEKMFRQYNDMSIAQVIADVIKKERTKNILLNTLHKADFNIQNIYVKKRKIQKQQRDAMLHFLQQMIGEGKISNDAIPENTPVIWITHAAQDGSAFDLELNDDSNGAQEIINNLAELLYLNESGGLMLEDELGKNYHSKLTKYFFSLFNDTLVNTGYAQLLFSSHDAKILNLLNYDQIYLVDKDENGAIFVKLLDDYIIRENEDLELGYLNGRYGAIPDIKE